MIIPLFRYTCACGHNYKLPRLSEFSDGEFVLISDSREVRYLNAIIEAVIDEVLQLVRTNEKVIMLKKQDERFDDRSLFQRVCSVAFDKAADGSSFRMDEISACPKCNRIAFIKCEKVIPKELVDVKEITFNDWNRLTKEQRKSLIDKTVILELNKLNLLKSSNNIYNFIQKEQ